MVKTGNTEDRKRYRALTVSEIVGLISQLSKETSDISERLFRLSAEQLNTGFAIGMKKAVQRRDQRLVVLTGLLKAREGWQVEKEKRQQDREDKKADTAARAEPHTIRLLTDRCGKLERDIAKYAGREKEIGEAVCRARNLDQNIKHAMSFYTHMCKTRSKEEMSAIWKEIEAARPPGGEQNDPPFAFASDNADSQNLGK